MSDKCINHQEGKKDGGKSCKLRLDRILRKVIKDIHNERTQ